MLGELERLGTEAKSGEENRRRIMSIRHGSSSSLASSSSSLSKLFSQLKESAPCVERMLLEVRCLN